MQRAVPGDAWPRRACGALVALAALCFAHGAGAVDREWVRYSEFVKRSYIDRFYAAPAGERDALVARVSVKADTSERIDPLEIRIPAPEGVIVLRPDETGTTDFPFTEALLRADPMLLINLPAGIKAKAMANLQPRLPLRQTYALAELARPLDQANALIKSQAGMLSFAIPKVKRVVFKFPPQSDAVVTLSGSAETVLRADKTGLVSLLLDDTMRKSATRVTCSQVPTWLDIDN